MLDIQPVQTSLHPGAQVNFTSWVSKGRLSRKSRNKSQDILYLQVTVVNIQIKFEQPELFLYSRKRRITYDRAFLYFRTGRLNEYILERSTFISVHHVGLKLV